MGWWQDFKDFWFPNGGVGPCGIKSYTIQKKNKKQIEKNRINKEKNKNNKEKKGE